MIGRRLLHYEVTARIGEGGMGVVWRARDTSLDREAAIKVLPEAFAADGERLARFEREARLLASLDHPNIASVYGLHVDGGERFLAMELVDGEDLSERIGRGPIPTQEAIAIALGIARALEAAHASGIVHRDLKPANVRLAADGRVKVLDFGLAKALESSVAGSSPSLSVSPTLTAAHTAEGVLLGTAAYMAPEQARGRGVDRRADLWALGVVLFEMLSGRRLFEGETVSDLLAEVLKTEPDWELLPADVPPGIHRLLRRCLRKDPDRRLHDAADARIELEEAESEEAGSAAVAAASAPTRPRPVPLLAAAAVGLVAGGLLWPLFSPTPSPDGPPPIPVRRSEIPVPGGEALDPSAGFALSPDGSMLAIGVGLDPPSRLFLRPLDSTETEPIAGTEEATFPFFSPDGNRLGFFRDGVLRTVSVRGSDQSVETLCDAPVPTGAAWSADGWIYFLFGESRLARVREGGGEPEPLGEIGEVYGLSALPGGRGLLITQNPVGVASHRKDAARISVLTPGGEVRPVLEGGYGAKYLVGGFLVFLRGGGLHAVPFDLESLEATPPAVGVQPNVFTDSIWGGAFYDVASDGTLVYAGGGDFARTVPTWVDLETGDGEPLPIPADVYNTFDVSPDGTRVAIQVAGGGQDQIHVFDARRGTFGRLTLEGANSYPVWSADGREVFYTSFRDGKRRIYRQPVDGSAPASPLLTDEQAAVFGDLWRWAASVTPDGRYLLVGTFGHPVRGGDLWKIALDGSGATEPILETQANEIIPQISPDGRWLAHLSDRAGPYQIVVRPFPDVDRREWVVSGGEGFDARWSPRGDALFYRAGWRELIATPVTAEGDFEPGTPRKVMDLDFHDAAGSSFAFAPDGKKILVNRPVDVSLKDQKAITLVTGWAGEVSRRLAAGR